MEVFRELDQEAERREEERREEERRDDEDSQKNIVFD
jgi:hypothetical protein